MFCSKAQNCAIEDGLYITQPCSRRLGRLGSENIFHRYANLERSLGEVDRARAILVHASGMADPRSDPSFWEDWKVSSMSLNFQGC